MRRFSTKKLSPKGFIQVLPTSSFVCFVFSSPVPHRYQLTVLRRRRKVTVGPSDIDEDAQQSQGEKHRPRSHHNAWWLSAQTSQQWMGE